ncbi:MAG: hypothetical protein II649_08600, partial [Kiritimatiellae bacterium]|nr:hypothetical protein [Kiritimatiellia bacterium]
KWAQEHGMTLEEAIKKHKEWNVVSGTSGPRRLLNLDNRPSGALARPPRPSLLRRGGFGARRGQVPVSPAVSGLELARTRRERMHEQYEADEKQRRMAAEQARRDREAVQKAAEQAAEERRAQREQVSAIQEMLRQQREEKQAEQERQAREAIKK